MNDSYSLAYSPCPNDTFIFAALTNGLLENAPHVHVVLDDVEALNTAARSGVHELTKVSYGAIPFLTQRYRILRSGGALGRGCGPLLIARPNSRTATPTLASLTPESTIAIPGEMTTAYLLLRLALGFTPRIEPMRFDLIVDAVARGDVDAGLIIHESRFTYTTAGLISIVDLGQWWEGETGRPIPLGAILIRRDLSEEQARRIDDAIARSLDFAYAREPAIIEYVRAHAFEMDDEVMHKHIDLYVNAFSRDLGDEGMGAIDELFARGVRAGLIPAHAKAEFVGA